MKQIEINGETYYKLDVSDDSPVGQYCIVRCRDSDVWAGIIKRANGRECTVLEARRLWSWTAKKGHTLSAVALYGISGGKLPAPVSVVFLTEACEYLPCSEQARNSIATMGVHNE